MLDMMNALFWFAVGVLALAGVFARSGALNDRINRGN